MKIIKRNEEYLPGCVVDFECPECHSILRESKRKLTYVGHSADCRRQNVYAFRCPVCEKENKILEDAFIPVR
jgi:hypothetical protein